VLPSSVSMYLNKITSVINKSLNASGTTCARCCATAPWRGLAFYWIEVATYGTRARLPTPANTVPFNTSNWTWRDGSTTFRFDDMVARERLACRRPNSTCELSSAALAVITPVPAARSLGGRGHAAWAVLFILGGWSAAANQTFV